MGAGKKQNVDFYIPNDDPLWREKTESIERIHAINRSWRSRLIAACEQAKREKREKR